MRAQLGGTTHPLPRLTTAAAAPGAATEAAAAAAAGGAGAGAAASSVVIEISPSEGAEAAAAGPGPASGLQLGPADASQLPPLQQPGQGPGREPPPHSSSWGSRGAGATAATAAPGPASAHRTSLNGSRQQVGDGGNTAAGPRGTGTGAGHVPLPPPQQPQQEAHRQVEASAICSLCTVRIMHRPRRTLDTAHQVGGRWGWGEGGLGWLERGGGG